MNSPSASVYQRVLGDDFALLSPVLKRYCSVAAAGEVGRGDGIFDVAGSPRRWLVPLLAFLGWRQVLFPEFERGVPFSVTNTAAADGTLSAVRSLRFAGRTRELVDTMSVVDGRLHDRLGRRRGLEARFHTRVVDAGLSLTSDRLWLHLGPGRVPLPRVATVTISERWHDDAQHVDVRLTSPLLGEWFRYAGTFTFHVELR